MWWCTDAIPALKMPKPGESQVTGQARIHKGSVKASLDETHMFQGMSVRNSIIKQKKQRCKKNKIKKDRIVLREEI